jgi:hypothetical protein
MFFFVVVVVVVVIIILEITEANFVKYSENAAGGLKFHPAVFFYKIIPCMLLEIGFSVVDCETIVKIQTYSIVLMPK